MKVVPVGPPDEFPRGDPREALLNCFKMCAMSFGSVEVQASVCGFFSLKEPLRAIHDEARTVLDGMSALGPAREWTDWQVAKLFRHYERLQDLLCRSHRLLHAKLNDCASTSDPYSFPKHGKISNPFSSRFLTSFRVPRPTRVPSQAAEPDEEAGAGEGTAMGGDDAAEPGGEAEDDSAGVA